jgi:plastocyanin
MGRSWKWAVAVMAALAILVAGATPSSATTTRKVSIVTSSVTYQFAFSPKTKSIHKGVRVKWTNDTGVLHHIKFTNGKVWSKDVTAGSSVSRIFHHAGTFHYHCTIHRYMKGVIKVT